jgi:Laminin G domain
MNVEASVFRVDDGSFHQVSLTYDDGKGYLRVDGHERHYIVMGHIGQQALDLSGGIYVGGNT